MRYRQLGASGLEISVLTMGTMTFGGKDRYAVLGSTDLDGAKRQIDQAMAAGVNIIDSANSYSAGLAEEIVGQALGARRNDVLLATKVRMRVGDGPNDSGLSRFHIMRECEASLRRLRTDHIDLYQAHEWDGWTPLEETLEAFADLEHAGKIRYVGCSNYAGWQLMKALGIADQQGLPRFVSEQIHYTLQAREAEYELVPIAVDQGLGIMVWSPLAGGLLSGKYRRGQPEPEGRRLSGWNEPPVRDPDRLYDIVDVLVDTGNERAITPARVALAWTLDRPSVSSVVIGARTEEQLADNLGAADLSLTEEEQARLEVASRPPLLYPYWHQAQTASDRLGRADRVLLDPYLAN
jgi:aryl-alcohol dehydrogenase-like predicted oxidoreductase